jgi:predicted nucleic acid-binding protein
MNKYVIDSSAWIEYFMGTDKGRKVQEYIIEDNLIYITGLIVAEVTLKFMKENISTEHVELSLTSIAQLIMFDFQLGIATAEIYLQQRKKNNKFGLSDAHIAAAAKHYDAKIITFDTDFTGITNAIILS